jgi:hypothetical protein
MGAGLTEGRCVSCGYFRNDAAFLEAAIPGLSSLSSGDASVRADDGLCLRHDRFSSARARCGDFIARSVPALQPENTTVLP